MKISSILAVIVVLALMPVILLGTPPVYFIIRNKKGRPNAIRFLVSFYFGLLSGLAYSEEEINLMRSGA